VRARWKAAAAAKASPSAAAVPAQLALFRLECLGQRREHLGRQAHRGPDDIKRGLEIVGAF
jgi:hypothetical protein